MLLCLSSSNVDVPFYFAIYNQILQISFILQTCLNTHRPSLEYRSIFLLCVSYSYLTPIFIIFFIHNVLIIFSCWVPNVCCLKVCLPRLLINVCFARVSLHETAFSSPSLCVNRDVTIETGPRRGSAAFTYLALLIKQD